MKQIKLDLVEVSVVYVCYYFGVRLGRNYRGMGTTDMKSRERGSRSGYVKEATATQSTQKIILLWRIIFDN